MYRVYACAGCVCMHGLCSVSPTWSYGGRTTFILVREKAVSNGAVLAIRSNSGHEWNKSAEYKTTDALRDTQRSRL